jgi:hypothetical protein
MPSYSYPVNIGTYYIGRVVCDRNPIYDKRIGHIMGFGLNALNEITIEVKWAGSTVSYNPPENLELL